MWPGVQLGRSRADVVAMRSLMAARLVLLDADQARRDQLSGALAELAAFDISGIATVAEAAGVCTTVSPDLIIVEGPSLAANDEADEISSNPFATSGIPTILLLPNATNEQRRKGTRAGYAIVLGTPVSPRLLYRRIAHVLQNARRAKRRVEAAAARKNTKRAVDAAENKLVSEKLLTKLPAR